MAGQRAGWETNVAAIFARYRPARICLLAIAILVSSCATKDTENQDSTISVGGSGRPAINQETPLGLDPETPAPQLSVFDTGVTGAFLAARQALFQNDIEAASRFFSISTQQDKTSAELLERSFITHYQNGDLEQALHVARLMERQNIALPLAAEPGIADAIKAKDWQAVIVLSSKIAEHQANLGLSNLLQAYAHFAQDSPEQMYQSLHAFEQVSQDLALQDEIFIQLQLAHFSRLSGQDDKAEQIYQNLSEKQMRTSYLILRVAEGLWYYGQIKQAEQLLDTTLSPHFDSRKVIQKWKKTPPTLPALNEFIASTLLELSWFSKETLSAGFLLPRTQLALSLWPDFDAAHYVSAVSFQALGQNKRAQRHLDTIDSESLWYQQRILLELDGMQENGNYHRAAEHIQTYQDKRLQTQSWGKQRDSEQALFLNLAGNFHRYQNNCAEAIISYLEAVRIISDDFVSWRNLAICYEQTDKIEQAEDAFAQALILNPEDPVTLNYLGYWWADEGRNLDKAITHIQKAVALRPRSGYYADSLGWVYYKLGQFEKAVTWLEKAIQLAPTDGIIADHLGDAYWQVGRHTEAHFKWNHALELGLTEDEKAMTTQKIKHGLSR